MCGIAGQFAYAGKFDRDEVAGMANVLLHRGPNSHGYYLNENLYLANTRL